ncbi:MAG: glycosyltransferase [Fibrobacteraceae bacterium]|nr:glycosyltransferase [Fibrobacteraceae bacterium]
MNLLYNLVAVQPIHNAKFHGGGSYGEVVFRALLERLDEECKLFCAYDGKKYLDPDIIAACKERGIPLLDINESSPQEIIDENSIDTFYTPLYSLERKWDINVKRFVFTWHGVRALEMRYSALGFAFAKSFSQKAEALVRYRESWKRYFYKPKYQSLAKRIAEGSVQAITVSEHSRASIQAFFPELMNVKIPVFYSPMAETEACGGLPDGVESEKYFLLTSGARWEKNNLRAVMAFDDLFSSLQTKENKFKVVVTGVTNPKVYTAHLRHKERFVLLDYVEAEQLEALHKNAYAFIFPSLNEGFGYPPIQSMRYGIPVAASGTTSIPEICGNAALYFDPYSESEIKNRFIQLLDPDIYRDYSERAKCRYAEVSRRQKEDLEKTVKFILGAHEESSRLH